MGEWLTMSGREAVRLGAIQAAAHRQIRQARAAVRLGIERASGQAPGAEAPGTGAASLVSARRGKRPANAIAEAVRERAPAPVSERYPEFSPTRRMYRFRHI